MTPKKKFSRRQFLLNLGMWGGLIASYGTGAFFAFRYLVPRKKSGRLRKIFVATVSEVKPGKSIKFQLPDGNEALILRLGEKFLALSNTCPHLGCKVKWRGQEHDFFCPCHNGVFNENGVAIEGPPATENKNLTKYDLEVVGESLFIKIEEV